jgi:hypothetical protein
MTGATSVQKEAVPQSNHAHRDCGAPIDSEKLRLCERYECTSLGYRFHYTGWLYGMFFPHITAWTAGLYPRRLFEKRPHDRAVFVAFKGKGLVDCPFTFKQWA